jgi:phage-related protein
VLVTAVLDGVMSIVTQLPVIIPALLQALIGAFNTAVLGLVNALPTILTAIIGALVASIPVLIQGAVALFMGLALALPIIIPELITALVGGITTIVEMLPTLLPLLLGAAIGLFLALVKAVPVILPQLITAIVGLVTTLVTTIPKFIPQILTAAVQLLGGIIKAVPVIIPALVTAGKDLIDGLIKGILAGAGALKDAVVNAAKKALTAAKEFLGIKSPSTAFAWVGKMVDEGWAEGIAKNDKGVVASVKNTAAAMIDAASNLKLADALAASAGMVPLAAGYDRGSTAASSSVTTIYQIGDVSIPGNDPAAQQVFGDLLRLVKRYQRMVPMEEM